MKDQSSVLDTIQEFAKIFGHWFSFWILNVLFGVVNGILDLLNQPSFPAWLWMTTLVIGLVLAPFYAFHKMKQERDNLNRELHNRRKVIAILNDLSKMRASGVSLRNAGMTPLTRQHLDEWLKSVDKWHLDLQSKATKLASFERGLLETLNWVKQLYLPQPGQEQQVKTLNELNETLERLGRLIEAYRPILWS